jgi:hypothetical protein
LPVKTYPARRRLPEALVQQIRRFVWVGPFLVLACEENPHGLVLFHVFGHAAPERVHLELSRLVYDPDRAHHAAEVLLDLGVVGEVSGAHFGDLLRFRSGRSGAFLVELVQFGLLVWGEVGALENLHSFARTFFDAVYLRRPRGGGQRHQTQFDAQHGADIVGNVQICCVLYLDKRKLLSISRPDRSYYTIKDSD